MGKGTVGALLTSLSVVLALATQVGATQTDTAQDRAALNTWSIVAADPGSGAVGVAGASCFPEAVDAIAALVPGVGAAATQAEFDLDNRNRVFQLLQEGRQAEEIIDAVTQVGDDPGLLRRQYGVVTIRQGQPLAATFTGDGTLNWAGSLHDPEAPVAVQGNLLEDEAVVAGALDTFREAREAGRPLEEQLLRALEAGSAAGGDRRCNTGQRRQTASAAFIMVAQADEAAYAAPRLGASEAGQAGTPSLYLSVTEPIGGENAVELLRQAYNAQNEQQQEEEAPAQPPPIWRRPDVVLLVAAAITLLAMGLTAVYVVRRRGEIGG